MRLLATVALFAWDKLPDSPDPTAVRFLLDLLPDQWLLTALQVYRGKGRNDWHRRLTCAEILFRFSAGAAALVKPAAVRRAGDGGRAPGDLR